MRKEIVTYYCDYCKEPVAENQLIWDIGGNMIEFKNGSKTKCIPTSDNVRSKRSEFIGFYCINCHDVHEDYPIKNIIRIGDNMTCKESHESIKGGVQ